jgi:hypothetical protein
MVTLPRPAVRVCLALIAIGFSAALASGGSAPTEVFRQTGPDMISPGEHHAEDLVFDRERLRHTIVTVQTTISCFSKSRCVMNLPAPLDDLIGVELSELDPPDQQRVVLSFAGRNCQFKMTGFFDGVELNVRKLGSETVGDCGQ